MPADPWSAFLDLVEGVIAPDWGAIVQWLPVPMLALVVLWVLRLVQRWSEIASPGDPRLAVAAPAGARRGGPLVWPLLIPVGALVAFAGLLVPSSPDEQTGEAALVNVPILLAGLALALFAVAASVREWERRERPAQDPEPSPRTEPARSAAHLAPPAPPAPMATPTLDRPAA